MQKVSLIILLILSCTLLISCAQREYVTGDEPRNVACIKGGLANFFRHFTAGEAHVGLQPMPIGRQNPYREYCLTGGKHRFLVSAARGPGLGVNTIIIVDLVQGHRYRIRAK